MPRGTSDAETARARDHWRSLARRELAPDGLAAGQGDGDVTHRGIDLGAVPMALARFDVSDVTDLDLKPLGFRGNPAAARGDDQDLIAVVNVPASVAALAEVHDAAIEILRLPRLDDGLAGAMHGPGVAIRRFRRARRG